jgi:hypothetical protein
MYDLCCTAPNFIVQCSKYDYIRTVLTRHGFHVFTINKDV